MSIDEWPWSIQRARVAQSKCSFALGCQLRWWSDARGVAVNWGNRRSTTSCKRHAFACQQLHAPGALEERHLADSGKGMQHHRQRVET